MPSLDISVTRHAQDQRRQTNLCVCSSRIPLALLIRHVLSLDLSSPSSLIFVNSASCLCSRLASLVFRSKHRWGHRYHTTWWYLSWRCIPALIDTPCVEPHKLNHRHVFYTLRIISNIAIGDCHLSRPTSANARVQSSFH